MKLCSGGVEVLTGVCICVCVDNVCVREREKLFIKGGKAESVHACVFTHTCVHTHAKMILCNLVEKSQGTGK